MTDGGCATSCAVQACWAGSYTHRIGQNTSWAALKLQREVYTIYSYSAELRSVQKEEVQGKNQISLKIFLMLPGSLKEKYEFLI